MADHDPIRTKPARSGPPPIRRFAASVLVELARRTKFVDPSLAAAWRRIVGPELAALCRPGKMTGGGAGRTLEVVARDGAAAARVQFEAEAIRRAVNEFLGPDTLARVAVRQTGRGISAARSRESSDALGSALGRFRNSVGAKKP
jgi:hypothetical protein